MSRPASVKSDNIFLVIYHALTLRRTPIVLRVVLHTLLLVGAALALYAAGMVLQLRHAMHQHVDALGHSLVTQTAASATGLLAANDALSLHVLLNNLVQNPLVAYAGIQGADGRVLAEAGQRPRQGASSGEVNGQYSMPLTLQNTSAGRLFVALDMAQFNQPLTLTQQHMGLFGLGLLLAALILSFRLGRQISVPINEMRHWLDDPKHPFPSIHEDEIGGLLQQLRTRLAPELEADEEEDTAEEETPVPVAESSARKAPTLRALDSDDIPLELPPRKAPAAAVTAEQPPVRTTEIPTVTSSAPNSGEDKNSTKGTRSAVLALQLGSEEQLRSLPKGPEQQRFQQQYRELLHQIAQLYRAELNDLADGSTLMLFHSHSNDQTQSYLSHALCCGELLRSMAQDVQASLSETGVSLTLQLGLGQTRNLSGTGQNELLLDESVQSALALSRHSRNLLLLDHSISNEPLVRQRARVHPVAKPAGACCVERLQDPYPALLERQRALLIASLNNR